MDGVMEFRGWDFRLCRSLKALFSLVLCSSLVGCSFDPFGAKREVREVRTSTGEDVRIMRGDVRRLQQEVNSLSARFDRFSAPREREVTALKSAVSGLNNRVGQMNQSVLAEVDRKIAELDAKTVADKNQLVAKINSVVDQINALSRRVRTTPSPASGGSRTITEKGFEYTVVDGDSLWGIASKFKEYGVTVDAIRQANDMSASSSRIVTGQKLFIPVKK